MIGTADITSRISSLPLPKIDIKQRSICSSSGNSKTPQWRWRCLLPRKNLLFADSGDKWSHCWSKGLPVKWRKTWWTGTWHRDLNPRRSSIYWVGSCLSLRRWIQGYSPGIDLPLFSLERGRSLRNPQIGLKSLLQKTSGILVLIQNPNSFVRSGYQWIIKLTF